MSSIRSRITLILASLLIILASLLISVGGGCGRHTKKAEPGKKETTPAEPKGPGGGEMK
jgi:hypothetical protein